MIPFWNRLDIQHTCNWKSNDYIKFYKLFLNRYPNFVIANNNYKNLSKIKELSKYTINNQQWVKLSKNLLRKNSIKYYTSNYVDLNNPNKSMPGDVVIRSPGGHDDLKLLNIFKKILKIK